MSIFLSASINLLFFFLDSSTPSLMGVIKFLFFAIATVVCVLYSAIAAIPWTSLIILWLDDDRPRSYGIAFTLFFAIMMYFWWQCLSLINKKFL